MYRIKCSEIWGGIHNQDEDICSAGITASLYSASCDGGKGGDIYYLSVCQSDDLTRIAIADVMGHGEAVSQVSQGIYDALKTHMNDLAGDELLAEVNQLAHNQGINSFATATVAGFYKKDRNLYFSYAGHHPTLIKRKQDQEWFEAQVKENSNKGDGVKNLPLAVQEDTMFDQEAVPLSTGDRIFIYTDGIIEAQDKNRELFGFDRLKNILNARGEASLSELKTTVLDELRQYTDGKLDHDDVTFLVIEIN